MKRNDALSLRAAQPTSTARTTGFNKHTVETFFKIFREILLRYKFQHKDIYNFDETGNA